MAAVNIAATNHRIIQVADSNPTSLPNDLNSRFETDNSTQMAETLSSLELGDTTLTFETVVRALRRTRVNSSPGPDNISGRDLRLSAEQLGVSVSNTVSKVYEHRHGPPTVETLHCIPHSKENHHKHSE